MKKTFFIIAAICVIFSFFIGLFLGFWRAGQLSSPANFSQFINSFQAQNKSLDFSLFQTVWDQVKSKYVGQPVDEKKLFYGALSGMVASLGDPYSSFLNPELTKNFESEITGSFEGIGAEIGIKNDQLVIISPLPGSPAEKAGLKAQDAILQINGTDTSGMALDYATSLIRGKQGTTVTLTILSPQATKARDVAIKRETIKVDSVRSEVKTVGKNKDVKIGYIQISTFSDDTVSNFKKAEQSLTSQGVRGIILDLRNNSGGYLDSAVSISSQFVEKGPVVIEEFSDKTRKSYEAEGDATLASYPVVVLINEGTASAAEIVAGALHDYGLAELVGEKSFGKGSVQEYQTLSDGSSLKITTAKWLTPKGNSINEQGIEPDVKVELTTDDYNNNRDPQLDKALEIIGDKIK